MAIVVKLFYVSMCFLVVASNPLIRDNKTVSHIELNIRPLKKNVESNTISESQYKEYDSDKIQNKTEMKGCDDKLLVNILNFFEKAGNNLSPKPSNPQLFTMLRVFFISKKSHTATTPSTTTEIHPEVVSTRGTSTTTESISTTTEQYYDDDDESTRPIKFLDTKTIDLGKLSKNMPQVEHGSVQYTT